MKILSAIVLYTALAVGANTALADVEAARALRQGDMKKLVFYEAPKSFSALSFETIEGDALSMADYKGKVVLLNFWATWCGPCRQEMPMLSELQTDMGGTDFEVVTIATGRNPPPAIKAFFDEMGIANLPLHRDPRSGLARATGVMGLPVTLILDRNGMEIARLFGDAPWNSDNAKAILQKIIGSDG